MLAGPHMSGGALSAFNMSMQIDRGRYMAQAFAPVGRHLGETFTEIPLAADYLAGSEGEPAVAAALYRSNPELFVETRPVTNGEAYGHLLGAVGEFAPALGLLGRGSRVSNLTPELVQSIATRADNWGIRQGLGNGPVAGTLKHGYAERLLNRYQGIYGDRGLTTEARYLNGVPWRSGQPLAGSINLDVVEGPLTNPVAVYDYKFGGAVLTAPRIAEIQVGAGLQPSVPIYAVRP